jgi:sterol desaturase/sphingolipid hydroxylase (fatty acid hydroxylase superfamily)
MTTTFFICFAGALVLDALLLVVLDSKTLAKYRIRTSPVPVIPPTRRRINTGLNNLLSLAFFAAYFYFIGEQTLYAGWPGVTKFLGEVLGVLLLYDFMYYFFHRAMHIRKIMRFCHAVHHRVRFPMARESVFLHPFETVAGLGLLILAIAILGPVSTPSFLAIFLLHSSINLIVHSNLVFPHPVFRLFNFWVTKHDVHHNKARNNYASIFPFWDQAFGTSE